MFVDAGRLLGEYAPRGFRVARLARSFDMDAMTGLAAVASLDGDPPPVSYLSLFDPSRPSEVGLLDGVLGHEPGDQLGGHLGFVALAVVRHLAELANSVDDVVVAHSCSLLSSRRASRARRLII